MGGCEGRVWAVSVWIGCEVCVICMKVQRMCAARGSIAGCGEWFSSVLRVCVKGMESVCGGVEGVCRVGAWCVCGGCVWRVCADGVHGWMCVDSVC